MMTIVIRSSSMIHPRMSGAVSLSTKWFGLPWLSSCDTSSQWVGYQMVVVLQVKCTASKDNPKNGKSSSNPCRLLDTVLQLPPPSPPLMPVGELLISEMARLYSVTLWRCTAVKPLSGTLLTPYLYLVGS